MLRVLILVRPGILTLVVAFLAGTVETTTFSASVAIAVTFIAFTISIAQGATVVKLVLLGFLHGRILSSLYILIAQQVVGDAASPSGCRSVGFHPPQFMLQLDRLVSVLIFGLLEMFDLCLHFNHSFSIVFGGFQLVRSCGSLRLRRKC